MNFKKFLEENLKKAMKTDTINSLGDRSAYIGASDISGCLRKSFLGKVNPKEISLEQAIVFERGHNAEAIIRKALEASNINFQEQVEVIQNTSMMPIKAHLDFVVESKEELVVIEVKSTSINIEKPYDSWAIQLQLQMGLLQKKNPEKKVRGYVIALNINNGFMNEFHMKFNETLFEVALNRAKTLAEALQKEEEPEGEEQLYCSKCPYKMDCSTLLKNKDSEEEIISLPKEVVEIVERLQKISSIKKEEKALKEELESFLEAKKLSKAKAGESIVSIQNRKGRVSVDSKLLQENFPDVFEEVKKEGKGYTFLSIK